MGLNIILCNFAEASLLHPLPVRDERFDSTRYERDRWFSEWLHGGNALYRSVCEGMDTRDMEVFVRPRDLEQARHWVRTHIGFGNQQRWLDLFDLLEADTHRHLWLQEIS